MIAPSFSIIDFADARASLFGRPVRGARFEPEKSEELGIIIADGTDGPFTLEVASISTCEVADTSAP